MIQLKRDARQIAGVLEQGEEREKDRHRRQHDRNDGREHAPHAVGEQGDRAGRQAERGERTPERRFEPEQESGKHGADGVRAGERQPENEREQQEHEGNAEAAAEHNTKAESSIVPVKSYNTCAPSTFATSRRHDPQSNQPSRIATMSDTAGVAETDKIVAEAAGTGGEQSEGPKFTLELTQDQKDIRDWAHGFAEQVVRPAAR